MTSNPGIFYQTICTTLKLKMNVQYESEKLKLYMSRQSWQKPLLTNSLCIEKKWKVESL